MSLKRPTEKPTTARGTGAIQRSVTLSNRLDAWWAHHSTSAIESLIRMLSTPLQSLLTWVVVAIAVVLPAALGIAMNNLQTVGSTWIDSNQISVFLRQDARPEAIKLFQEKLQKHPDIIHLHYISPDQALTEFKAQSGLQRVVDSLDKNPLPGVFTVQPNDDLTPVQLEKLQVSLQADPLVAEAVLDMQWVKRLHEFMALTHRITMGLGILLALGIILIIGNTIRLTIESRREEILVTKLVGATDAYVRRPFLYTGLWYGLGGGILASVLLTLGITWLNQPVARLAALYQSDFLLAGAGFIGSLQLILMAGLIGVIGAWIAVGRHLSQLEPH